MFEKEIEIFKKRDPVLCKIINIVGPCTLELTKNPFQALVESILYQQLATNAAKAIIKKFLSLYPDSNFPSPQTLLSTPEEKLKAVGISNQKIKYLKDLSKKFMDGTINPSNFSSMTDEEIIKNVMQVKGIGKWTAKMFLIFCLGRPDVFPAEDFGVKKAIEKWYGNTEEIFQELSKKWQPYRTVAVWYLWRSLQIENI